MDSEVRWNIYLEGLSESSKNAYVKRVGDYIVWCNIDENHIKDPVDAQTVYQYLVHLHSTENFCASTLWTLYSMISAYYEAHHNRKTHVDLPIIQTLLKQWEKEDRTRKAKAFSKEEIYRYLTGAPNDDFHHPRKVATVLAIHGLLRKVELTETQ